MYVCHLFLTAFAFLEVHPALLPLLGLCILLGKALIALPTLLQLALFGFALLIILVGDLHILHRQQMALSQFFLCMGKTTS